MTIQAQLVRNQPAPFGSLAQLSDGRHAWLADVPTDLGGGDLGADPHDLLDSALAGCTLLTLELYIRRKQLAVSALRVQIEHEETKAADGRVRYQLRRQLHIEGELSAEERQRLLEIANKCPIHRVLTGEISVGTSLA
ncbi:MAG TPA: OsmC family protein [Methylibium sp.]